MEDVPGLSALTVASGIKGKVTDFLCQSETHRRKSTVYRPPLLKAHEFNYCSDRVSRHLPSCSLSLFYCLSCLLHCLFLKLLLSCRSSRWKGIRPERSPKGPRAEAWHWLTLGGRHTCPHPLASKWGPAIRAWVAPGALTPLCSGQALTPAIRLRDSDPSDMGLSWCIPTLFCLLSINLVGCS